MVIDDTGREDERGIGRAWSAGRQPFQSARVDLSMGERPIGATDTLIACTIARRLAADYSMLLLPPVTLSCSHEHAGFAGSVSVSSATLRGVIRDVALSLEEAGVPHLVVVNAHGGNYVLS